MSRAYNFINLTGMRFGFLVAHSYISLGHGLGHWHCKCDCGEFSNVPGTVLRQGRTRSCGCLTGMLIAKAITKHGKSKSREHAIWRGMITRCGNPNRDQYPRYKGMVCERWLVFDNFFSDMGTAPSGLSIDRIDNERGYEPGNCRWADAKTQARNRRPRRFYRKPANV